jgi:DNA-binding CsgD family transcriptional regulator
MRVREVPRRRYQPDLTPLEHRILLAYANGACRAEIGEYVGLSEHTVSNYLTIAKEKLGARSLAHAAYLTFARSRG